MLPRKFFNNLHTAMAILALFVQFSDKGCSYFWSLLLSASPNTMDFVGYAQFCLGVLKATKTKAYCNEEVRNYGKIVFIQSIVGRWGGCIPPLDPFLTGTLLFQIDDNRASQGRMRYVLFYSYGKTSLATW